jgi:hypothetical protein
MSCVRPGHEDWICILKVVAYILLPVVCLFVACSDRQDEQEHKKRREQTEQLSAMSKREAEQIARMAELLKSKDQARERERSN